MKKEKTGERADRSQAAALLFPEEMIESLTVPLLDWYRKEGRTLPWREGKNPYRIWISEIMLQQTRIEAVKPYFERFMKELPDIASLAAVPEDKLLKLWEGLGYYSRARNLKKAAEVMTQRHEGKMPASYEELKNLPGIGPYTAGAIASLAFGIPVPAVDGNVLRVLSRVCLNREEIGKPAVRSGAWQALIDGMPKDDPGAFNEAIMELGETVCLPNGKPLCEACPLRGICLARKAGCQEELPSRAEKKQRRAEERTVLLFAWDGKVCIRKRPAKGLLAGLYEFPSLDGKLSPEETEERLRKEYPALPPFLAESVGETVHIFSHVEWHMRGIRICLQEKEASFPPFTDGSLAGSFPVNTDECRNTYAIPGAYNFFLKVLDKGKKKVYK